VIVISQAQNTKILIRSASHVDTTVINVIMEMNVPYVMMTLIHKLPNALAKTVNTKPMKHAKIVETHVKLVKVLMITVFHVPTLLIEYLMIKMIVDVKTYGMTMV